MITSPSFVTARRGQRAAQIYALRGIAKREIQCKRRSPRKAWLVIAWGVVTGILLILLFYRSTLTRQEDDQLFIDESSASRATEQSQLIAKVNKINPLVKMVGATSGLMILAIAGWAVYIGLNSVQP